MGIAMNTSLPWLSLLALGAAHGVNPAMGWLFAVGRGLQEGDRRAVWRALGPIALGHALAIGVVVLLALAMGRVLPTTWLRWLVAASLLVVGLRGLLRHRHFSLGGMRVSARELTGWSFLVASAHGAGLMVLPLVLGTAVSSGMHHQHGATLGLTAPLVHTVGYLAATGALAMVVYERVGLRILRRAWINLNVVWGAAMIAAGVTAMLP